MSCETQLLLPGLWGAKRLAKIFASVRRIVRYINVVSLASSPCWAGEEIGVRIVAGVHIAFSGMRHSSAAAAVGGGAAVAAAVVDGSDEGEEKVSKQDEVSDSDGEEEWVGKDMGGGGEARVIAKEWQVIGLRE